MMKEGLEIIDGRIYGRVKPYIYAFKTNTVPNFLKVGDTYRPVRIRLEEWRKHYEGLTPVFEQEAMVDSETFFRDYSVHDFLIENGHRRAEEDDFAGGVYRSNEFFSDAEREDVEDAIEDIHFDFGKEVRKYTFYNVEDRLPLKEGIYERNQDWEPRDNQKTVIDNFMKAVKNGRKNLLMYAVMRFGKSFTALCCAKKMEARLVVVVSGKADVKAEWQKNVQRPKILEGYSFLNANDLTANPDIISQSLTEGKNLVVFLTLQDLQGKTIKERHKDLFSLNEQGKIDLLIVDESHFAARSDETGKVLKAVGGNYRSEEKGYDNTLEELNESLKFFTPRVTLHLSGTPYRILLDGEFQKEDIIANIQYRDIIEAKQTWDAENLDTMDEWKNPYYGFPEMIRFAFNLNESSERLLKSIAKDGVDYKLNELFKPVSTVKDREGINHKKFLHEQEVYDLLAAIDGRHGAGDKYVEDGIFSFLAYPKIKENNMCRHIVMVLPFRASCDAMEEMLKTRGFDNLNDYEILNISGFECPGRYETSTEQVVADIDRFEKEGKKTITLTVGKMLTGSTVEQWDTMIFLRDTSSAQVYDQAIFRLQNKYLKTIRSADDKGEIIQNMKPQTLLVDFDPTRVFVMQHKKTLIGNTNRDLRGNENLEDQLAFELQVSPIILMNKDKIKEVEAVDIIDYIREYSSNHSLHDEAEELTVDENLFRDEAILNILDKQPEFGGQKGLFKQKPVKGDGDDIELPDDEGTSSTEKQTPSSNEIINEQEADAKSVLVKKLKTYQFKILLFAYLTETEVHSLGDIIRGIKADKANQSIAYHLDISVTELNLFRKAINPMALSNLDGKIHNSNELGHDNNADIKTALKQLTRLSASEVTTKPDIATAMVSLFPDDVTADSRFLCFAGKTGEFEYALIQRFGDDVKSNIFTIPTSGVTYECTRKMFKLMGIPTENILYPYTSFDLINPNKQQEITRKIMELNFTAAIGNPPYQEHDGGAGESSRPLYNEFVNALNGCQLPYYVMIMPSRWMTGGKNLDGFRNQMLNDKCIRELHDFWHPEDVFPYTNNRGGVCYFLRDRKYDNIKNLVNVVTHYSNNDIYPCRRPFKMENMDIFFRNSRAVTILEKVFASGDGFLDDYISAAKAFGLRTFFVSDPRFKNTPAECSNPVKCYGNRGRVGYVEKEYITSHKQWIDKWKVFVPESNNIGTELRDDNQNSFVGAPETVCTESFLVVGADLNLNEESAQHLSDYLRTRFARFMLSLAKIGQHGTSSTYCFVPLQDFTHPWTDADLFKKYDLTSDEVKYIESMIKPMADEKL